MYESGLAKMPLPIDLTALVFDIFYKPIKNQRHHKQKTTFGLAKIALISYILLWSVPFSQACTWQILRSKAILLPEYFVLIFLFFRDRFAAVETILDQTKKSRTQNLTVNFFVTSPKKRFFCTLLLRNPTFSVFFHRFFLR